MNIGINIILDDAPSQESGRFVEVENDNGQSVSIGEWTERDDGFWGLRIEMDSERLRSENAELESKLADAHTLIHQIEDQIKYTGSEIHVRKSINNYRAAITEGREQ